MRRSSLQPPAWYADRRHAWALRYWDGRRWTSRWRPPPGWAGIAPLTPARPPAPTPTPSAQATAPPSGSTDPGSRATAVRRARRLALASAGALAAAAMLGTVLTLGRNTRVARISDAFFVRSANGACAAALDPLRRERRPGRLSSTERAARIDRLASTLDDLAGRLRAIPVRDADRPAVGEWLSGWDGYTAVGRDLAASLRAGDGRSSSLRSRANLVDLHVQLFSRVNGLDQCVF